MKLMNDDFKNKLKRDVARILHVSFLLVILSGCIKHVANRVDIAELNTNSDLYYKMLSAQYAHYSNDFVSAYDLFLSAIADYPHDEELRIQFINFLIEMTIRTSDEDQKRDLVNEAITACKDALEIFPKNTRFLQLISDLYVQNGNFEDAIKSVEKLRRLEPESALYIGNLAQLYLQTSNPKKALQVIDPILKSKDPTDEILHMAGIIYLGLKEYQLSEQYLTAYLERFPNDYETNINLVILREEQHRFDDAITLINKLLQQYPKSIDLRYRLALLYERVNKIQESIQTLEPLQYNSISEIGAKIEIARLLLLLENPVRAKHLLEEVSEKDPQNLVAQFYLGLAYCDLEEWTKALETLSPMLNASKPAIVIYDLAAFADYKSGNLISALRTLELGISKYPDNQRLYLKLAGIYLDEDFADKAEEIYIRGINRMPLNKDLTLALSILYEKTGRWQKALKISEKLLKSQPEDPELNNFVGYTLADYNQDLNRAWSMIDFALKADPSNPAYLDSMGWVLYNQGKYKEALPFFLNAVQSYEDPIVLDHLSHNYAKLGMIEEAIHSLERAIELDTDNSEYKNRLNQLSLLNSDSK